MCSNIISWEMDITVGLTACTADEKRLPLRLSAQLHSYLLTFCPDEDLLPECSVKVASQCCQRFTAFMDTVDVDKEQICRSDLNKHDSWIVGDRLSEVKSF